MLYSRKMGGRVSQLDDVEYARLAAQVFEVEKLMNSGVPGGADLLLRSFLNGAKSRMEEIRHEERRAETSLKDRKDNETAGAVQLSEMERRLTAAEKQQYSGFLKLDWFTKADFEELEEFYAESWDRLSEGGKNQMSVRVWGGIRRHEYTFEELPQKLREKESERIYLQLTGAIKPNSGLQNVAAQVRAEFVREYEASNETATSKILGGDGFAGYSPETRTEASLNEASVAKPSGPVEGINSQGPHVKNQQETSLEGLTLDDSGSVPPTGLAVPRVKPLEKN